MDLGGGDVEEGRDGGEEGGLVVVKVAEGEGEGRGDLRVWKRLGEGSEIYSEIYS